MTKNEALRMAIEVFDMYGNKMNSAFADEAYQACKQALAETQEPITHVIGLDNDGKEVVVKLQTPLYTTPPSREWQSLRDEEIEEVYEKVSAPMGERRIYEVHTLAKALDAKLKEKNNGGM